jgi:hypothetical protein
MRKECNVKIQTAQCISYLPRRKDEERNPMMHVYLEKKQQNADFAQTALPHLLLLDTTPIVLLRALN